MCAGDVFLQAVAGFARTLLSRYDLAEVLAELNGGVTEVLGLMGSGVTLDEGGQLEFAGALTPEVEKLERLQERLGSGPCVTAYQTGEVVAVADIDDQPERWPEYVEEARSLGVASVAGIPMQVDTLTVGALNLYGRTPREWTEEDVAVARVFADMATGYILYSTRLAEQAQLNAQLQRALDSRIVIEQAKGIVANAHGVGLDRAFELLRNHARNHHCSVRAVADAVVTLGLRL